MASFKIPKDYKSRLKDCAQKNDFASADEFAQHLIDKGIQQYDLPDPGASLDKKFSHVVDEQGYSSAEELIEHLLERGLMAYEEPTDNPEELEKRLRGLGYIE